MNLSAFQLREMKTRMIYLENFPNNVEEKNIRKSFKENGDIEKIWLRLQKLKDGNDLRKCAYILFKSKEDTQKVAENIAKYKFDGSDFEMKNKQRKQEKAIKVDDNAEIKNDYETTIFIRNIHQKIQENDLREHFKECGKILAINLVKDKESNRNAGIAYIKFESKDEMEASIKLKNKTKLKERSLKIVKAIEIHKPKESEEDILRRREKKLLEKTMKLESRQGKNLLSSDMEIFLTNARKNLKGNGRLDEMDFNNNMSLKKKERIKVLEEMIESRDKKSSRHQKIKNKIFKDVPTLNEAHRKKRKLRKAQNMKKFTKIKIKKLPQ
ncbi:rna-binding protein 34 [Stylonychia lemnae]|uniref:Rna-binding protein 34 n=1 Tax=Stylonychia lemnae TaxID=5949 RepID=A0A078AFZ7_STYLE|nr:rna-binding protein 34 [Stylonychia lemnae]|eukprot:CDW81149.1 rna-binding protein 34 [Stylonychia lemnae]